MLHWRINYNSNENKEKPVCLMMWDQSTIQAYLLVKIISTKLALVKLSSKTSLFHTVRYRNYNKKPCNYEVIKDFAVFKLSSPLCDLFLNCYLPPLRLNFPWPHSSPDDQITDWDIWFTKEENVKCRQLITYTLIEVTSCYLAIKIHISVALNVLRCTVFFYII